MDKKKVSISHSEIQSRASRIFAIKLWVEQYGKAIYYIKCAESVPKVLKSRNFSDEWELIRFGHRFYVYLSEDKIGKIENGYRIKLTPLQIEQIRKTDFTVKGVQRQLAKKLGVHESTLSRIRHQLRRTQTVPGKKLSNKQKKQLFITNDEVREFFGSMWTVKDFYQSFKNEYKIRCQQDVYNMSAKFKHFKLPENWHSIRVGESWLLYYSEE